MLAQCHIIFILCFLALVSPKILRGQNKASIFFSHNSAELNNDSKKVLDSLADLKSNLTFRIYGHANPLGGTALNLKLSENRARNVTDYLQKRISHNIHIDNTVGLGESKQINDNSTEELLAQNRRVDIFIQRKFQPGDKIFKKPLRSFTGVNISDLKVYDTLSIPGVNFQGGRHIWLPNSEIRLLKLTQFLKENPTAEIELQGHICCDYLNFDGLDSDLGTYNLSYTRAEAIRNFLIRTGIDPKRIRAVGLGHLNPMVYPEITNEDRTRNRRVDFVLIKK